MYSHSILAQFADITRRPTLAPAASLMQLQHDLLKADTALAATMRLADLNPGTPSVAALADAMVRRAQIARRAAQTVNINTKRSNAASAAAMTVRGRTPRNHQSDGQTPMT
jgi:hypothetical protein